MCKALLHMLTIERCTNLDKHLIAKRCLGGPGRRAVDRHGLPVTRELQCELLLHQLLNYLVRKAEIMQFVNTEPF